MKRIVVVDDDIDIRQSLDDVLRAEGFDVFAAPDGRAAVDLLEMIAPDLLLLDWMMPGFSGADVIAALDAREQRGKFPIVVVTASLEAMPAGIVVLRKPFTLEALLEVVRRVTNAAARAG